MAKFIIEGEHKLAGEITVAGNKNAALPIIAATVLTDEPCELKNIPEIRDVVAMLNLLENLGKTVERSGPNHYKISGTVQTSKLDDNLAGNLRASILFLGALLARTGKVEMRPPGGCVLGRRNVDSHFTAITALGADLKMEENKYFAELLNPRPADLFLIEASVTATENAMLLASGISGETTIRHAASEPHVADLAIVLGKMGVTISGAGSGTLGISGVKKHSGFEHRVMADFIEAGTFAIAAACTQSDLIIHDACREDLRIFKHILEQMNVRIKTIDNRTIKIFSSPLVSRLKKIQVGTWPGFPTDLMSPMIVLATQAKGVTLCHDWMYESRMFFVDKLIAMGAEITQCDPHRVLVAGPCRLRGQQLSSPDIRAGIALMIAAMCARGTSRIDNAELIDRGYEDIAVRLNRVGAKIERVI